MNLEQAVSAYIAADDSEQGVEIARNMAANFTLLNLVTQLGSALTSTDGPVRARATNLLVDYVDVAQTNANDRSVLAQFFSAKLTDPDCMKLAAEGIVKLNKNADMPFVPALNDEFLAKLREIDMLSLNPDERRGVYQLFNAVPSSLVSNDVCQTFTSLSSGEKDPENLLLLFGIASTVLNAPELTKENLKDVYNITFCYYPVKFNPPKDLKLNVTADDLKLKLGEVLKHPKIAQFVVPGLVSKVGAINMTVKIDVYESLARVMAELNANSVKTVPEVSVNDDLSVNLSEIVAEVWNGVKRDILDMTRESQAYSSAINLLKQIANGPESATFFDFLKSEFYDPEIPQHKLTQLVAVLCELVVNNSVAWSEIGPLMTNVCLERTEPQLLTDIVSVPFKTWEPEKVIEALIESKNYTGLALFLMNKENPDYFFPAISQFLVRERAYPALAKLAEKKPEQVCSDVLPELLEQLPETLDALASICCKKPLVVGLIDFLVPKIEVCDLSIPELTVILKSMQNLATNELDGVYTKVTIPLLAKFTNLESLPSTSVLELVSKILELAASTDSSNPVYWEEVRGFLNSVPFYLILSALASSHEYPFGEFRIPSLDTCKNDFSTKSSFLRLVALTANKKLWKPHLERLSPKSLTPVETDSDTETIELVAWRVKGELLSNGGFDDAKTIAELAVKNALIARVFGVLVSPDRFLTKDHDCVIRPLFRQRLYNLVLPVLAESVTQESNGLVGLSALTSLIEFMPPAVIKSDLKRIVPILMKLITLPSPQGQYIAISTLNYTVPASAEFLDSAELVNIVLELSTTAKFWGTRSECLQILMSLYLASKESMSQFKDNVIRACIACLDDKKREVRSSAAACRQLFTKA